MEFSKYLGVADDECSSSESGWTMYIVSSMHDETTNHHQHDHVHVYDHDDNTHGGYYKMHHNEDSDDSMVSDASSAPSRQRGISKKRSGLRRESKHALNQKQEEKKLYDRRQRAVKEEHKTRIDAKAKKT
ncbi:putative SOB-five-Like (SOFL) family [Helianthus annuus]|nr:putative SOB-five-Like (SOFL) family [Helianthus annuus]